MKKVKQTITAIALAAIIAVIPTPSAFALEPKQCGANIPEAASVDFEETVEGVLVRIEDYDAENYVFLYWEIDDEQIEPDGETVIDLSEEYEAPAILIVSDCESVVAVFEAANTDNDIATANDLTENDIATANDLTENDITTANDLTENGDETTTTNDLTENDEETGRSQEQEQATDAEHEKTEFGMHTEPTKTPEDTERQSSGEDELYTDATDESDADNDVGAADLVTGDLNGNNVVDMDDFLMAAKISAGLEPLTDEYSIALGIDDPSQAVTMLTVLSLVEKMTT